MNLSGITKKEEHKRVPVSLGKEGEREGRTKREEHEF
jgi:hypothetical protein